MPPLGVTAVARTHPPGVGLGVGLGVGGVGVGVGLGVGPSLHAFGSGQSSQLQAAVPPWLHNRGHIIHGGRNVSGGRRSG